MNRWPKQHKILRACVLIFAAAAVAAHIVVVRPRQQSVAQLERSLTQREAEIRAHGWPANPAELGAILSRKQNELRQIDRQAGAVNRRMAGTFSARLAARLGEQAVREPLAYVPFLTYLTRLDYEEDFGEIVEKWKDEDDEGKRVTLHEDVLHLSQNSVSPHVYQLIFHIWTVERLVDLALDSGLRPVNVPIQVPAPGAPASDLPPADPDAEPGERLVTRHVAKVTALPSRGYLLNRQDDATPYIVEFPVAMTVRATMADLTAFLQALHDDETFLPVSRLQIRKIPPQTQGGEQNMLEVDLECSAFLMLREELKVAPREEARILPRGA